MANKYILLTIDVEDWFQVENFKPWIPFETWDLCELRVERNVHLLLDLFDSVEVKGGLEDRKARRLEGKEGGSQEVEFSPRTHQTSKLPSFQLPSFPASQLPSFQASKLLSLPASQRPTTIKLRSIGHPAFLTGLPAFVHPLGNGILRRRSKISHRPTQKYTDEKVLGRFAEKIFGHGCTRILRMTKKVEVWGNILSKNL